MQALNVLLVEPWMSGSHAQWADGYARWSSHSVSVIGLPAGPWRWRLRAGSTPLAQLVKDHVATNGPPDVLLLSGLVDGAQLLGMTRRVIPPSVRLVVYQHESQLVYPTTNGRVDEESVLRNWSTWLAADKVLFNSDFHRKAVEAALPTFLARQPEADQLAALDSVLAKFDVLPVGIELGTRAESATVPESSTTRESTEGGSEDGPSIDTAPIIIWPHRWEPDKDPDAFVRVLAKLDQHQLDFRLVLAGSDSMVPNDARRRIIDRWSDKIVAVGPFPRIEYEQRLAKADIVVSCAKHDFFGVGVAEAVAAGCVPVLPDALAYPELIEERWHEVALYQPGSFGSRLVEVVGSLSQYRLAADGLAKSMTRFGWGHIAPRLDEQLAAAFDRAVDTSENC